MTRTTGHRWLSRYAAFTAAATLALICAGGLVTSHGAGMAVPDWPNTYGYNMFFFPFSKWIGGIFYEHTHRLVASAVGLLTTILALWVWGGKARAFLTWASLIIFLLAICLLGYFRDAARQDAFVLAVVGLVGFAVSYFWPRGRPCSRVVRWLGIIAFVGVIVQGVVGGLRVRWNVDYLGIPHAMMAQLFFLVVCAIALMTSQWWRATWQLNIYARPAFRYVLLITTVIILVQLVLGATMRHQHAGLAVPDFPMAYGKLWPATDAVSVASYNQRRLEANAYNPITATQIRLHMAHRFTAMLILLLVGVCAEFARRTLDRNNPLTKLSLVWFGLILAQLALGAATVWTSKSADIATAHVAVGALSLMVGAITTLMAFRCLVASSERSGQAEPEQGTASRQAGEIIGSANQVT
jgi:cytochrome c oxidase assembly protein subunit 15